MDVRSRLIETAAPAAAEGVVLVLHGGGSRSADVRVSPTQLSVLRMVPIAQRVARAGRGRLAVFRLLNSVRGWDTSHTPVDDARWAMAQVRDRFGDLPVCLVGHSLGGRAAMLSAGEPAVRSVVALAPWVYPEDGRVRAPGRRILIVHGTDDRIANPARAEAAAALLRRTAQVSVVRVNGGKHAMLRHHDTFDGLAAQFAAATLLGAPAGDGGTGPLAQVLAGADLVDA
jgi:pimeloyl-ACP methyl ester carboxylesterase